MTYKLPFGLKQKPLNKYVDHGVIKFSCRNGKLYYKAVAINKTTKFDIVQGEVKTKEELQNLLLMKAFPFTQKEEVAHA